MTMDSRRPDSDSDPDPDSNSDRRLHLLPFVRASHLAPDEKEGPVWLIDGLWMKGGVGILGGAPKSALCRARHNPDHPASRIMPRACLTSLRTRWIPGAGVPWTRHNHRLFR